MPPTILFKPLEAKLTRNTEYLGKMSPYCTFSVGRQKIKGKPCKKGGKTPTWTDSILIPFDDHPTCLVQIKHKDLIKDCKIGSFEIDLYQIEAEGNSKKWYTLFHNERPTGEILIETIYYPKSATQSMTNLSTPSRNSLTNSRSSQDDSTNSNQRGVSNNFSPIPTQLRRAGSAEISGNVLSPVQGSSSGPRRDEEYAQEALMRGVGAIQGFNHTHYGRSLSFP